MIVIKLQFYNDYAKNPFQGGIFMPEKHFIDETDARYMDKARDVLQELPDYVTEYMNEKYVFHTKPATMYGYAVDLRGFFKYFSEEFHRRDIRLPIPPDGPDIPVCLRALHGGGKADGAQERDRGDAVFRRDHERQRPSAGG